ncbi:MAG: hypothetical protein QNJ70_29320 [Xenococcaceae cyanobacterium MO_207.B15]|nr:hypothetical protein [Xenococcaceae cyanobacterium MO_207.B15]
MSNQSDLKMCDRLILPKSLKIPQRSRLYSLEPIFVGLVYAMSYGFEKIILREFPLSDRQIFGDRSRR